MTLTLSSEDKKFTAFNGSIQFAEGTLADVSQTVLSALKKDRSLNVLVFDNETGKVVDLDPAQRPAENPRSPGRPKLGVISREVTLLPRHWDWLNKQSGGASVALRKLVEDARRTRNETDRIRFSQEAVYQFLVAVAGNKAGFEEGIRALYRGNLKGFKSWISTLPKDIAKFALILAKDAFKK